MTAHYRILSIRRTVNCRFTPQLDSVLSCVLKSAPVGDKHKLMESRKSDQPKKQVNHGEGNLGEKNLHSAELVTIEVLYLFMDCTFGLKRLNQGNE